MKSMQDLARLAWAFAALDLAPRELTRRMSLKQFKRLWHSCFSRCFLVGSDFFFVQNRLGD